MTKTNLNNVHSNNETVQFVSLQHKTLCLILLWVVWRRHLLIPYEMSFVSDKHKFNRLLILLLVWGFDTTCKLKINLL